MYIPEFEKLPVVLKTNRQALLWSKKIGYTPEINKIIYIHWTYLLSTTFRRLKLKLKCDCCGKIFEKDTRQLLPENNFHLCNSCSKKNDKNPQYGKPKSKKQIEAHKQWLKENGNPFTWDEVKLKIKSKQKETTNKVMKKITGSKRSQESCKKISDGVKLAYKTGKLKSGSGWSHIKTKYYNGIEYQGSYELKFLKFIESKNKLNLIERGPRIQYVHNNNEHTYIIDYKIKNTDIVFEIKSNYYWDKNLEVNIIKKETAEKIFNYNLVINNNFSAVQKYFI
jgi:hypothetical protein